MRRTRRLALLAVFLLASTFYGWTAASAGDRAQFVGYPDYYAELTQGFLHGELSITTPAPKGLLALADPYDPLANDSYRTPFGDLALYHGKLYVDWGPAPVFALYLPWHLLGLGWPSGNLATWLFSVVGLAFALLALDELVDRYLPRVRARWLALLAAAMAFSSAVPFIDREPDNYEVAVACGYCFSMLALWLLLRKSLSAPASRLRLALASVCIGLAASARQDLLLLGLGLLPLYAYVWRSEHLRGSRAHVRLAAAIFGPLACCMILLAAYNYARFGNPLEIGSSYQLAGFNPRNTPYYQLSYLVPSLWFYLVSPIHFGLNFPFLYIPPPIPPVGTPISYQPQIILGVLSAAPIVVMLVVAPLVLARRLDSRLRGICITMVLVGLVVVGLISWSIPGGSERYAVDFSTLLVLPAGLCWLAWSPTRQFGRVAVRLLGSLLLVAGIVVGLAVSYTGYYNQLSATNAGLYNKLQSSTSWVGPTITRVLGHPVVYDLNSPAGIVSRVNWDSYGVGTIIYMNISGQPSVFSVMSPSRATWSLTASFGPGPQYGAAKKSPIYLFIHDATGTHRYPYVVGTDSYPVTVASGRSDFRLWIGVGGRRLPPNDSVLACSGMTFHGPALASSG